MKDLLYLSIPDLYILAMLGRGHYRHAIAAKLRLCHPAISNRIRRMKLSYPNYFERIKNAECLTPEGVIFSKVCYHCLSLLSDGNVTEPERNVV